MMEKRSGLPALSLAALGVVYGDIGTSPIYAFRVALQSATKSELDVRAAAIGISSLIVWSLVAIVAVKYALLILRADNRGEGGVVAMIALLGARNAPHGTSRYALLILGLIGAALLYGDGAITPSISVLSAVEGLAADTSNFRDAVLPVTFVILIALFLVQPKGTGFIGRIFGPVMLIWFATIAAMGLFQLYLFPQALKALWPIEALAFLAHAPLAVSFAVLGAVFLAVTGGEAMYADMGHFGRKAIRTAWFLVAMPALVLNYLGQAALIVDKPEYASNPFYGLAPPSAHYPIVVLATASTVIASQAIISGVFSLTQQAMQLGFLPRMRVLHTARHAAGQIYIPVINWLLAIATLLAVALFQSSDALAGAYGIAVSGLMAISTFLAALIAIKWGYNPVLICIVNGIFMTLDLIFFAANSVKLIDGGWFPLVISGTVAFLMLTWHRGTQLLETARAARRIAEDQFIEMLDKNAILRVAGTAAFLSRARSGIPLSLAIHVRHNKALQERILLVSLVTEDIPFVEANRRSAVSDLSAGFQRVILRCGFMETPNIPEGLYSSATCISPDELRNTSYYIGHETIIPDSTVPGMWPWRESVFMWMHQNSAPTGASFGIPSEQLVEVGTEIRL